MCFNPRSREGNDGNAGIGKSKKIGFNPRSREGNDSWDTIKQIRLYDVSIHVPARGTTLFFQPSCFLLSFQSTFPRGERQRCTIIISLFISLFQSTFPRGERPGYLFIISPLYMFQSTFPRGERLHSGKIFLLFPCFNPRSREGNDNKH